MSDKTDLVVINSTLPAVRQAGLQHIQRHLTRQLTEQTQHMATVAEAAKTAVDEISAIHDYTALRLLRSLESAEQLTKAFVEKGGQLSSASQIALSSNEQVYLATIHETLRHAGTRIVLELENLSLDELKRSGWDKLLDFLKED